MTQVTPNSHSTLSSPSGFFHFCCPFGLFSPTVASLRTTLNLFLIKHLQGKGARNPF
jgi:hypothetical protein